MRGWLGGVVGGGIAYTDYVVCRKAVIHMYGRAIVVHGRSVHSALPECHKLILLFPIDQSGKRTNANGFVRMISTSVGQNTVACAPCWPRDWKWGDWEPWCRMLEFGAGFSMCSRGRD